MARVRSSVEEEELCQGGEVGAADGEERQSGAAQRRGCGLLVKLSVLAGPRSTPTKFSPFFSQSKRKKQTKPRFPRLILCKIIISRKSHAS